MNLTPYFKSIIDQDVASVVICNLKHEIIYMNPRPWRVIINGVVRHCLEKVL